MVQKIADVINFLDIFETMGKFRKILYIVLYVIGTALTICAILSVFRNTESRFLKMLDFPRIQSFLALLMGLVLFGAMVKKWHWYDFILTVGLLGGLVIQGNYLINYTTLVSVEVPSADNMKASDDELSLLITNVKMTNRKARPLIELIALKNPDLILAMEVDEWWHQKLKFLENEYPYSERSINNITYGMVLYSKFPLLAMDINYLQNEEVPSLNSTVSLSDGKQFSFHGIHPVPPTYFKDLPDNEGQQEKALKKLGRKILNRKLPTLVAGDLNDVVWSRVDELTGTENLLFDVRKGRGFYNSYNAENIFMRWPLDHIFVTEEFRLKKLQRLPYIDSDHFPIYAELVLQ